MITQDVNVPREASAVNVTDDREAHSKFWVAAYTRPRSEKKAAAELSKKEIEIFVPIQKQLRKWSDRKKLVEAVIMPMIIFAYISEENIQTIKQHPLIIKILTYPGKKTPAHIPEIQIENIKRIFNQPDTSVEYSTERFSAHDNVIVINGSLKGLIGKVKEPEGDKTSIWIAIDLLGGIIVKLKSSDLERIT